MKKQKHCECPAYPFKHRQGGGKCNLPDFCDFMEPLQCLTEDCDCEYIDDCPLVQDIRERFHTWRTDDHPSLTVGERNSNYKDW